MFAIGEHHNPPFFSILADHAARLHRGDHQAADRHHVHDADHDQRPGAHRRGVRDAPAPVQGPDGPDARPRQHRPGLPVVRPGHPAGPAAGAGELQPAAPAVARGRGGRQRQVPHPAAGLHLDPASAGRRAAVRLARLDPHPGDRRAGRVLRRRLLRQQHLLAEGALHAADPVLPAALRPLRPRHREAGHRRPRRPGLHREELPGRQEGVPPLLQRGPGLRPRAVHGGLRRADPAVRWAARRRSSTRR